MKDSHLPKLEEIAFRFSHTLEKETLDLKDGNERSGVSETVAMRIPDTRPGACSIAITSRAMPTSERQPGSFTGTIWAQCLRAPLPILP